MSPSTASTPLGGYWLATHRPLQSLYFLLPLLAVYELGTVLLSLQGDATTQRILAEAFLKQFFSVFGFASVHLPAITVVVVLLAWHLARRKQRDPVAPQWRTLIGMLAESLILTLPLFVLQLLTQRAMYSPGGGESLSMVLQAVTGSTSASGTAGTSGNAAGWASQLLLSFGAGIYEELVFRLLGIAVLGLLLEDVLALPRAWAGLIAVAVSSLAFAWYHFWGTGAPIAPGLFAFYAIAGVYFAGVYVLRGFGIVVAVHAFYDVLIVSAPLLASRGSG